MPNIKICCNIYSVFLKADVAPRRKVGAGSPDSVRSKIWIDRLFGQSFNADVAQLVEQRIRNAQVVGPSPIIGSNIKNRVNPCFCIRVHLG